jgi:glyoxylase-like metal-dependent hydrolase (beta-lactamase superfamily II)
MRMKLHLFNLTNFLVDGGAMFGVIPKLMWSRVYKTDHRNLITLSLRSMIIETEGRIILIDTGWGDKQDEKFFRHSYLNGGEGLIGGLKKRGFNTEDITDVLLTHLHADHCGGAMIADNGYKTTFPNAIYHVSRVQWEWAVKNNLREEDSFLEENFLPLKDCGHLNLVDTDGSLFENVFVKICFGHTPGLMIPIIKYKNCTLIFAGDLIPTVAHIPLLWNMSYDIESLKTINEKAEVLKQALEKNSIIIFQHDEHVECCTLKITTKGIGVDKKFDFDSLFFE